MTATAEFTVELDPDLRDAFLAEAAAAHSSATELVRNYIEDYVERQRGAREHDAWFRAEMEQAVREADDPDAELIPHDDVAARWRQRRAELVRLAGAKEA